MNRLRRFSLPWVFSVGAVIVGGLASAKLSAGPSREALLRELMSTDVEFSWACQRLGRMDAFLNYMTEDAMVLNRGARGKAEARRVYENDPPGMRLMWGPTRLDISAAGDLGYSMGIWLREGMPGPKKQASGIFMTIWRRQPDGTLKWIADGGASFPDETIETLHRSFRASGSTPAESPSQSSEDVAAIREKLFGLEREISRRAGESSVGEAFSNHLADDVFVYDTAAYTKDAALAAFRKIPSENRISWNPVTVDVAASGDLAWVWGIRWIERLANADGGRKKQEGTYVDIWKRQPDHTWKLVVQVGATPPVEAIARLQSALSNAQPSSSSDSWRHLP